MKSFIAAALAMTPRFLAAELARPVHFALSYDEEVGCIGVRGLIEDLRARTASRPAGCIVGEPTEHAAGDRAQGQAHVPLLASAARRRTPRSRRTA